jgi:hypothetical protein
MVPQRIVVNNLGNPGKASGLTLSAFPCRWRYPVIRIAGELAVRSTALPFSVPWIVYVKT